MFRHKELVFFSIAGVFGYLVDLGITAVLSDFIGPYFARLPAFLGAATVTWLFNRSLTFKSKKSVHEKIIHEYFHYLSLMVLGLTVNYVAYAAAVTFIKGIPFYLVVSVGVGSLAGLIVNYLSSKKYIFKTDKVIKNNN